MLGFECFCESMVLSRGLAFSIACLETQQSRCCQMPDATVMSASQGVQALSLRQPGRLRVHFAARCTSGNLQPGIKASCSPCLCRMSECRALLCQQLFCCMQVDVWPGQEEIVIA